MSHGAQRRISPVLQRQTAIAKSRAMELAEKCHNVLLLEKAIKMHSGLWLQGRKRTKPHFKRAVNTLTHWLQLMVSVL